MITFSATWNRPVPLPAPVPVSAAPVHLQAYPAVITAYPAIVVTTEQLNHSWITGLYHPST